MPNWCEGVLKLRGPKENHMRFFKEGLQGYKYIVGSLESAKIPTKEWLYEGFDGPTITVNLNEFLYIKDTKRAFVEANDGIYTLLYGDNNENHQDDYVSVLPFKQAWKVHLNDFEEIAKKYELDIRIFAVEKGMGFWQEISIGHDGIVYNIFGHSSCYADFMWDCPYPMLGG